MTRSCIYLFFLITCCANIYAEAEQLKGSFGYFKERKNDYGQIFTEGLTDEMTLHVDNNKITQIESTSLTDSNPLSEYFNSKEDFSAFFKGGGQLKSIPGFSDQLTTLAKWKDAYPWGHFFVNRWGYAAFGENSTTQANIQNLSGLEQYYGRVVATLDKDGIKKEISGTVTFYVDWTSKKVIGFDVDFPSAIKFSIEPNEVKDSPDVGFSFQKRDSSSMYPINSLKAQFFGSEAQEAAGTFYMKFNDSRNSFSYLAGAFVAKDVRF